MECNQPALQLLLLGLPIGQEHDYSEQLRNSFDKGVIMGHKPYYQRSAILFVQGFEEAILVMKTLLEQDSKFKGIYATLRPEEIIRLRNKSALFARFAPETQSNLSGPRSKKTSPEGSEGNSFLLPKKCTPDEQKEKLDNHIKVFVGCLPKNATDEMVKEVFDRFGEVTEAHVLRDNNGQTKYSAFVYYTQNSMALDAIRNLDKQHIMPEGTRPIEVRLAEKRCFRVPKSKDIPTSRDTNQRNLDTENYDLTTEVDINRRFICESKLPCETPISYKLTNVTLNYPNKKEELLHILKILSIRRTQQQPYYE